MVISSLLSDNQACHLNIPELNGDRCSTSTCKVEDFPARHVWLPNSAFPFYPNMSNCHYSWIIFLLYDIKIPRPQAGVFSAGTMWHWVRSTGCWTLCTTSRSACYGSNHLGKCAERFHTHIRMRVCW